MSDQFLTTMTVALPDGEFERAETLVKIRPHIAALQSALADAGIEASVTYRTVAAQCSEPAVRRAGRTRKVVDAVQASEPATVEPAPSVESVDETCVAADLPAPDAGPAPEPVVVPVSHGRRDRKAA